MHESEIRHIANKIRLATEKDLHDVLVIWAEKENMSVDTAIDYLKKLMLCKDYDYNGYMCEQTQYEDVLVSYE